MLRRNDMQRTVRVLRIALPIAIIAFIALLATKWDPAARGKHGVASGPVTSTQRPNDEPQGEGRAFRDV